MNKLVNQRAGVRWWRGVFASTTAMVACLVLVLLGQFFWQLIWPNAGPGTRDFRVLAMIVAVLLFCVCVWARIRDIWRVAELAIAVGLLLLIGAGLILNFTGASPSESLFLSWFLSVAAFIVLPCLAGVLVAAICKFLFQQHQ